MDPRKVAASNNNADLADDFGDEERVLEYACGQSDIEKIVITDEQCVSPSELFPSESAQPMPRRSTVLDFGELPIVHGAGRPMAPPAAVAVRRSSIRQRHSSSRAVRLMAIVTIAMALIVAGAFAMMNRVDVPNLLDDLVVNRTSAPAVIEVSPPAEAVHDAASAVPPPPKVDGPSAGRTPVPAAKSVTSKSRSTVQQKKPQPTRKIAANAVTRPSVRQAVPPRPARPAAPAPPASFTPPSRQTAEGSPSLALRAGSTAPAVPAASSAPAVPAAGSAPAVPAAGSAPAVPAAGSAPAVPVANSAPAAPVSNSAAAVPVANSAAPIPPANSAQPALAASAVSAAAAIAAPPVVNRAPLGPAPPSPGLTTDTRAVAMTLNRYQQAFSALDANAAHAVWPTVDVKALAKAFGQLEEQTFELEGCNISVTGARAEADCAGNARYIRKVGNRALRVEPRHWHFKLQQAGDQWVIDAVDAR